MDISEQTVTINVHSMLPVGTLLQNGKYRIERYLSSGGFGNTYVATNTEFEEQVAIKEFFIRGVSERDSDTVGVSVSNKENVEQFSSQKEKFKKEARRLRRLRNEHIVGVHDLFEENGTAYYEMDLIKGESLSERLKRTGKPLSEEEVLNILNQVLDALSVVHAQKLYHLDLKPGNIMVDESGRALLIDFGASKQIQSNNGMSLSTSSALAFTPGYAPLEQAEQNMKNFGPWTDLYALGATLYKLLTNLTPPSASDILMSVTPLDYPIPVSSRMKQLIGWMMRPSLGERPKSISDVKKFLDVEAEEEQTIEETVSVTVEESDLTRTVIDSEVDNYIENPDKTITIIDSDDENEGDAVENLNQIETISESDVVENVDELVDIHSDNNIIQSDDTNNTQNDCHEDNEQRYYLIDEPNKISNTNESYHMGYILLAIFIIVGLAIFLYVNKNKSSSLQIYVDSTNVEVLDSTDAEVEDATLYNVDDRLSEYISIRSDLGEYKYQGELQNNLPNGIGEAYFADGRYYKGPFVNGKLSGENALFIYQNGDEFRGTFWNNSFYEGTYTIAKDGSYFTGTFRNGQPDKGTWYDKNGNIIE